jgi:flagellar hook-associated protein 1 FlgK
VLTTEVVGGNGGVRVAGIHRIVDPVLLGDRRGAEAEAGRADVLARGMAAIEAAIGDPTQAGSLSDRVAQFSASLIEASSRPESELRLEQAVAAAGALATGIGDVGRAIQEMRTRADTRIGQMVGRVNAALEQVEGLNDQILGLGAKARESAPLQEARQQAIDSIAEIVPVREVQMANGAVALFARGGAVLLDGQARPLAFTPRGTVEPWMKLKGGALSGLAVGGRPIELTGDRSLMGGGALAAAFELRDVDGPAAQVAIDAIARDLLERFQDSALDTSLPAGPPPGPGLFTDAGDAFDASLPGAEEGLAQRLSLNAVVDPAAGGAAWRLRDGLGALAPGSSGDPSLLVALSDRLELARSPLSGPRTDQARSVSQQVAILLGGIATARQAREDEAVFERARLEGFRELEAAGSVDTDDEMQKLLVIEQSYAANARVIRTIDALMDELTRI